jgi:hypothetical protein
MNFLFYLSFFNYAFESLIINEFLGRSIIIDPRGVREYPGPGKFVLDLFAMDPEAFYVDIVLLICFAIFYIVLSAILLKYFVKEKR